ncbi:LOW QUALITY PROTEIN: sodium/hydrogen exchanger 9B2-like [Gastrophryne carolinensis]
MEHLAIAIRNNPDIKGIECGGRQYKASLFADDLLLHLTSPAISFPAALREFERFGQLSNFRINYAKSEALNLTLPHHLVERLRSSFPFKWQPTAIKYLGAFIPSDLDNLYELNFKALKAKVHLDLTKYDRGRYSWFQLILDHSGFRKIDDIKNMRDPIVSMVGYFFPFGDFSIRPHQQQLFYQTPSAALGELGKFPEWSIKTPVVKTTTLNMIPQIILETNMKSPTTNHIAKEAFSEKSKAADEMIPQEVSALLPSKNEQEKLPQSKSKSDTCMKIKRFCSWPPHGLLSVSVTNVIMVALVWAVLWSITGDECLPGRNLFGILVLLLCAVLGSKLVSLIKIPNLPPLPPLLGMLLAGFLLRNIPIVTDQVKISHTWSAAFRNIALTIILIRAGLGLDPKALRKLKAVCLGLSLGPCTIEACSAAVLSYLMMGLPLAWGFMIGTFNVFITNHECLQIKVPSMLLLQTQGYGVDKGVPTLLMAAGSFDDILAMTGFNTCFGMAFSSGSTLHSIIRGVLEVVVGMATGLFLGFFLHYENVKWKRSYLILLSIFSVFGSLYFGFPGSGGLCTLVMAFLGGIGWSGEKGLVDDVISIGWDIFQPLLFGLIGLEISIASLNPGTLGLCVATVGIALIVWIVATFLLVSCKGFNLKERIFISLAWIPKATVQAAIGSVALDLARSIGNSQLEEYGMYVLTIAFLAIEITAPTGAIIIGLTGPRMLQKSDTSL